MKTSINDTKTYTHTRSTLFELYNKNIII